KRHTKEKRRERKQRQTVSRQQRHDHEAAVDDSHQRRRSHIGEGQRFPVEDKPSQPQGWGKGKEYKREADVLSVDPWLHRNTPEPRNEVGRRCFDRPRRANVLLWGGPAHRPSLCRTRSASSLMASARIRSFAPPSPRR